MDLPDTPSVDLADSSPVDLYALPPEQFTAARAAQVKRAKADRDPRRAEQLAALRRPTVAAYVVNALVRAEPDLLDQLLDLGRQLGAAQAAGEGASLRELGEQRRQLVEAVTDRAAEAAGRELTGAVRAQVSATLEAALADPGSGTAVLSGRLVRSLEYAGFGGVDLDDAVAAPLAGQPGRPSPADQKPADRKPGDEKPADQKQADQKQADQHRQRAERARRLAEADTAALAAAAALDDAVREAERAEADRHSADAAVEQAAALAQRLEAELAHAREQRTGAEAEARRAARELGRRHDRVAKAQHAAERARAAVDRLRRQSQPGPARASAPAGERLHE